MKLLVTLAVLGFGFFGVVTGVTTLLSIDDLKECQAPDIASSKCAPADAIIVISGGDTSARTVEAVRLYKGGWAPKVVLSGAALDTTGPSNAEAMRGQALDLGVPDTAIVLEKQAINTADNARRTSALIGGEVDRVILVTSPYHQRRASIEFERHFGASVTIVNHPTPGDRLWPDYWWLTSIGWWQAIHEGTKTLLVMTPWH